VPGGPGGPDRSVEVLAGGGDQSGSLLDGAKHIVIVVSAGDSLGLGRRAAPRLGS
jgi:hypothetical protein